MADIKNIPLGEKLIVSNPKINQNFQNLNKEAVENASNLEAHKNSTTAHAAQNITYSGKAVGNNVKDAIDNTSDRISEIVAQSGDDNTEIVDARGGYQVLGDRLNSSDVQLAEKANQSTVDAISNSGFIGLFKVIPEFMDFNELTSHGVYSGIISGAKTNEPVAATTARLIILRVERQNLFIKQTLYYEAGAVRTEYSRIYDSGWSRWSQVYNTENCPVELAESGYQILTSGLIIQWGDANLTMNSSGVYDTGAWTFPHAHTTSNIVMAMSSQTAVDANLSAGSGSIFALNSTQFRIYARGTANIQYKYKWMSIGY